MKCVVRDQHHLLSLDLADLLDRRPLLHNREWWTNWQIILIYRLISQTPVSISILGQDINDVSTNIINLSDVSINYIRWPAMLGMTTQDRLQTPNRCPICWAWPPKPSCRSSGSASPPPSSGLSTQTLITCVPGTSPHTRSTFRSSPSGARSHGTGPNHSSGWSSCRFKIGSK